MIAKHLPLRGCMLAFDAPLEEFFASQLFTVGSMAAASQDKWFRTNMGAMHMETTIVDCDGRRVGAFVLRDRATMALMRTLISVGAREVIRQTRGNEVLAIEEIPKQAEAACNVADAIVRALTDMLGENVDAGSSAQLVEP